MTTRNFKKGILQKLLDEKKNGKSIFAMSKEVSFDKKTLYLINEGKINTVKCVKEIYEYFNLSKEEIENLYQDITYEKMSYDDAPSNGKYAEVVKDLVNDENLCIVVEEKKQKNYIKTFQRHIKKNYKNLYKVRQKTSNAKTRIWIHKKEECLYGK
jgi:hypothetical protein